MKRVQKIKVNRVRQLSKSNYGLPSLYLAIFLLSLVGLFAKLIPLDAVSIIQLRSVVAVIGIGCFMFFRKRGFRFNHIRAYPGVVLLGVLLGVHWVTFFRAMQVSSVAVGMLAMFTFPVVTILLEPFFTKQTLKMMDVFSGLLVLVGLAIMVGGDLSNLEKPVTLGVLFGVSSSIFFAFRNLFQKYYFAGETSDNLMFYQLIVVGGMLLMFVDFPQVKTLEWPSFFYLFLLGILSTAVGHTFLTFSLKQLPAKSVALIQCLQPLVASVLAWFVLGEVPGVAVLSGGGLILSVAVYESLKKTKPA